MANASYIIGLDQGTTGTTALLFDHERSLVAKSYAEHQQHFPSPGWVEHDPNEIFENALSVIRQLIQKSGISAQRIAGIGITNQRETSIVWNKKDSKPVHPAIVWQCRRTTEECEKLNRIEGLAESIQQTTGLTIDPYFSATKIAWILKHHSSIQTKDLAAGTIDSWLIWNFTKGKLHATDMTNASRTLLFDIHKREWSKDLCKTFQVPMEILPKVQPSQTPFGSIDASYFGHEIPILGAIGDQQAALFGHDATKPFQAKCTFGTGAFALVYCGSHPLISKNKLLTTLANGDHGNIEYALEGSVFMAGSIIQWLRDELKIIDDASDMDPLAKSISENEGVYLVPAFVGLGAPYWKPNVRGLVTGMHLATNRAHIARAALESIAYQICDLFYAMESDTGKPISQLAVDGGVTNSEFLMQFLADLLQIPIHRSKMVEMTAFGAAKLAATQVGWDFSNKKDFFDTFHPKNESSVMEKNLQGWRKAVSQALIGA